MPIPVIDVIIIYEGSTKADGGVRPKTTSLMIPPANPAAPEIQQLLPRLAYVLWLLEHQ